MSAGGSSPCSPCAGGKLLHHLRAAPNAILRPRRGSEVAPRSEMSAGFRPLAPMILTRILAWAGSRAGCDACWSCSCARRHAPPSARAAACRPPRPTCPLHSDSRPDDVERAHTPRSSRAQRQARARELWHRGPTVRRWQPNCAQDARSGSSCGTPRPLGVRPTPAHGPPRCQALPAMNQPRPGRIRPPPASGGAAPGVLRVVASTRRACGRSPPASRARLRSPAPAAHRPATRPPTPDPRLPSVRRPRDAQADSEPRIGGAPATPHTGGPRAAHRA